MFKELAIDDFCENTFKIVGKDWMLISAKKGDEVNTMTAGWGGLGVMWGKAVVFVVIRPQRYTKEFIDSAEDFSLTFFDDCKKQLGYLGSVSGRDESKINKVGFSTLFEDQTPYFQEGRLAILCKKIYVQPFDTECFVDKNLVSQWYDSSDLHIMYIGSITKILVKE